MLFSSPESRQVPLSLVRHLDRITRKAVNSEIALYTFPRVPGNDFEFDLSTKIDWQIEKFRPECITWTSKWLDYAQDYEKNVLVTEYKGLRDSIFAS